MASSRTGFSCSSLVAVALLCAWPAAVSSQQAGTVLSQTLSVQSSPTIVMDIAVSGPKTADTTTDVLIEFGPDGNAQTAPTPDPSLPAATHFTVSSSVGGSRDFPLAGGVESQAFPNKFVTLGLIDASLAPGLYSLTITHATAIPVGTTEIWSVQISELPRAGTRTIASIRQGVFVGLQPTGASQGPPAISIAPAPVTAGTTPTLTVNSSGGFNLSTVTLPQVTIAPPDGISNLGIGGATSGSLVLSFSVANCTQSGERTLTISNQNLSASASFPLTAAPQTPAISVSPSRVLTASTASLSVTSSGCFDLSRVTPAQVSISPIAGISSIVVSGATAGSLQLAFSVASDAALGSRTLVIANGSGSVATAFDVGRPRPPPPPPHPHCPSGQHCCEDDGAGHCTMCVPLGRLCQ
jgi:hypothetical protein